MTVHEVKAQIEKVRQEIEHSPEGSLALVGKTLAAIDHMEAFIEELLEGMEES